MPAMLRPVCATLNNWTMSRMIALVRSTVRPGIAGPVALWSATPVVFAIMVLLTKEAPRVWDLGQSVL